MFHEVEFPRGISLNAQITPMRKTQVVMHGSGAEHRNKQWVGSRRRYNAGYGIKSLDDYNAAIDFWEGVGGRFDGFRWYDWGDSKSSIPSQAVGAQDQVIGTGTGALATFQLVKTYGVGLTPWTRTIHKPISNTVRVSVNGVEKTITTQWTVDLTTGIITFTGGNIPPNGHIVRAGFEYNVPVRFDTDELETVVLHTDFGDVPSMPIVELNQL